MSLLRFSSFQRQSSKQAPEATSKNRKGHFFQLFKKALLVCVGVGAVVVFCFTIFLVWVSRDLPNPDFYASSTGTKNGRS